MSWLDVLPLVLAAGIFLLLPGGLLGWTLGLRGLPAIAAAGPLTVSVSAILAILLPYASIPWTAAGVLLGAAAAAGLVLVARRLFEGCWPVGPAWRPVPVRRANVIMGSGYLVGATLIVVQLALAFGTPSSYSQTFDNVFHLNGVRYVLDTANASSLTMSSMTSGDSSPYFYPAAWHGMVAGLVQLTGTPLTVSVNVFNVAVAAIVWPFGCMLLTRVFAGNRPVAVGAAGALSGAFAAFPLLPLDFGVLYPNFLSISILPTGLASVALFFGLARNLPLAPIARYSLPLGLVPGLALAHPNGLMSLLALSVPVLLQAYARRYLKGRAYQNRPRSEWILASSGLVAFAALFVVLWKVIRPPRDAAFWGPIQSAAGAAFEVLTNSPMNRPVAITVSVLMVLGLFLSWRRPSTYWLVAGFGIMAIFFVIVSGMPPGRLRDLATGVWYNDSYRIAALLPLTALPFAATGLDWAVARLRNWASSGAYPWSSTKRPAATQPRVGASRIGVGIAATVLAVAGISAQVPSLAASVASARLSYTENDDSPLVSSDEQRVIDQLDEIVPAGDVIAVNPWTGGALAYALADRETTAKHILTANAPDVAILNQGLRKADKDPRVCSAIRSTGVKYVLDFGSKEVHGGDHPFPGFEDLSDSSAVKLVLQHGSAKLYQITACGNA